MEKIKYAYIDRHKILHITTDYDIARRCKHFGTDIIETEQISIYGFPAVYYDGEYRTILAYSTYNFKWTRDDMEFINIYDEVGKIKSVFQSIVNLYKQCIIGFNNNLVALEQTNENTFEIIIKRKNATICMYTIKNNPIAHIFLEKIGSNLEEGVCCVELTDEKTTLLKKLVRGLLIEVSKKIAEGDISETNISILNYIIEFFKLCEELDYYSGCKRIIFYEERL